jgi:hypothetical protein
MLSNYNTNFTLNWNVNTNCTQIPIKKQHAVLNLGSRKPCQTTGSTAFQNILFTLKLSNLATSTFYKKNIHAFAAVHLITIHEVL